MKKINEEKGSITLYILVAMMLILSVTLLIYIQISQRNNAQLKELEKIQEEYQKRNFNYKGKWKYLFYRLWYRMRRWKFNGFR